MKNVSFSYDDKRPLNFVELANYLVRKYKSIWEQFPNLHTTFNFKDNKWQLLTKIELGLFAF